MSDKEAEVQEGENDEEMMNMFASVWVKVEVREGDAEGGGGDEQSAAATADENPIMDTRKPKRKRKIVEQLKCDKCDYVTTYKNCLEIHVLGHCADKPFTCEQCSYSSKYPSSLHRHVKIKHQETKDTPPGKMMPEIKCDHCDYTTHFKWNLNAHKRKHKLEKQFKCPQCPFETAYRHNLLKHGKVHRDQECFKCDKCPFKTKFEGHIQRHLAKIHKEVTEKYLRYRCEFCDFTTKERWRLNIHKQRSKQEGPMKCGYCTFETEYRCEYKRHKTSHYTEIYGNGRPLNCPNLLEEINTMLLKNSAEIVDSAFKNLVQKQGPECKPEPSEHKPDEMTKKYHLDPDCVEWSTIQVLESDDKDRPFQCHMCEYTSKFKASVQRHFQRHHTGTHNRPFKCCNCDFSTKTKDQIALHNKRSQSDHLIMCPKCTFSTNFKCKFDSHLKGHYVHKCHICNESFKHKYGLTKHIATLHLGCTLKCQYCDYKASRKESILCHETIHTGIKPFNCGFCKYSSVRKSLLNIHMRRHHGNDNADLTVVSNSKIDTLKVPLFGPSTVGGDINDENVGAIGNYENEEAS